MLRGFRHTLFLLLQVGVLASAAIAWMIWPDAWPAIAFCVAGALIASLICERIAGRYLRRTLGRLRRVADDIGHGRHDATLEALPGQDYYKLINAINLVAQRLGDASREGQRLQEELRRRERLAFLGELAATVAHEVNNPLDGIQNCSRILRRSFDEPLRARQMLDLIDSGLLRIDVIVRRLLTLAREHVIRPAHGRVNIVIDAALAMAAEKLAEKNIRVVRSASTDDDFAMIDAQLLEQVFVNLLTNAADSLEGRGAIFISLRRMEVVDGHAPRPLIVVEIADDGCGIPAEVLPHIFEPFFTTKSGGKGTGLGLPIAARIVDAHRGTLDVRPRPEGGTVFTVSLPAADSPIVSTVRTVSESPAQTIAPARVAATQHAT